MKTYNKIRVESVKGVLSIKATEPTGLHTHYFSVGATALRDLCRIASVPFKYVQSLSPTMIQQNINHGLAALSPALRFELKETAKGIRIAITTEIDGNV